MDKVMTELMENDIVVELIGIADPTTEHHVAAAVTTAAIKGTQWCPGDVQRRCIFLGKAPNKTLATTGRLENVKGTAGWTVRRC